MKSLRLTAKAIKGSFSSLVFRSGRCSRLGGCRPQSLDRERRDKRGNHNPTQTYGDRENSGQCASRNQVAVADCQAGDDGKIDPLPYAPPFDEPDSRTETQLQANQPGQNRPDNREASHQRPEKIATDALLTSDRHVGYCFAFGTGSAIRPAL